MNKETLLNILEFRIALEIGISGYIFANITSEDITELEQIVEMGENIGINTYTPMSEVISIRSCTKLPGMRSC